MHTVGLRRVALRLVDDSASADDLVQETLLAGLENPPQATPMSGPWLKQVLRKLAAMRGRTNQRRVRHEQLSARSRSLPSPAELVEQMELQRTVADEVLKLAEPFRTAILAFYFDDARAKEHAIALGISAATARSQVKRGIELLRQKLDGRSDNQRPHWSAALGALVASPALRGTHGGVPSAWARSFLIAKYALGVATLGGCIFLVARIVRHEPAALGVLTADHAATASVEPGVDRTNDQLAERVPVALTPVVAPTRPPADKASQQSTPDLTSVKESLRGAIETTLNGRIDPGAILDAALALVELDVQDYALPEPSRGGILKYPLLNPPQGLTAELWLRTSNDSQVAREVLALHVKLDPPGDAYFAGGALRAGSEMQLTLWTTPSGKVRRLGILTESPIAAANWTSVLRSDSGRIPTGVLYTFDTENPFEPTVDEAGVDGGSLYDSAGPVMVVGVQMAERLADLERLNAGLKKLNSQLKR